jgi:hypothetical protein
VATATGKADAVLEAGVGVTVGAGVAVRGDAALDRLGDPVEDDRREHRAGAEIAGVDDLDARGLLEATVVLAHPLEEDPRGEEPRQHADPLGTKATKLVERVVDVRPGDPGEPGDGRARPAHLGEEPADPVGLGIGIRVRGPPREHGERQSERADRVEALASELEERMVDAEGSAVGDPHVGAARPGVEDDGRHVRLGMTGSVEHEGHHDDVPCAAVEELLHRTRCRRIAQLEVAEANGTFRLLVGHGPGQRGHLVLAGVRT